MMRALLRPNEDSGSQIMEFALVLPLLVVFVTAIYDFGQAFNVKEKLNFAVKDGARFGAAQPTNDLTQDIPISVTAIRDLVDADLINAGIHKSLGPGQSCRGGSALDLALRHIESGQINRQCSDSKQAHYRHCYQCDCLSTLGSNL